jgi:hypothetical protein
LTERFNLRFSAEGFNLFNHPNFDTPNNDVDFYPNFGPNPRPFRRWAAWASSNTPLEARGSISSRHAPEILGKVRANYPEPVPPLGPSRTPHGIRLIPLADLVRMKLTSFRSQDETHLKDLDEAGLIAPESETGLPATLRVRLAQVRARE